MARDLIVRIIGDDKSLQAALLRDQKAVTRFGTTTTSGLAKVDTAFSRTQRIAAGGFVGGLALTAAAAGIRSVVNAAAESQNVLGQTKVALDATGKSWDQYGKQIEDAVKGQSRLGFDDEALLRTFSLFVRTTGDVNEALRDNTLAMDVARGRYIDLEQAAQLVNKAALGQAGALRRLGIDVKNGASAQELLTRLTEKYGGAARAAGQDASTAFDRAQVSIENAKEQIGGNLLPTVAGLSQTLADTLDLFTQLGAVKIPPIHVPLVFDFGGGDVGDFAHKAVFTLPEFVNLTKKVVQNLINDFRETTKVSTPELARSFSEDINSMFQSALTQAAPKVKVPLTPAIEFDRLPGVRTAGDDIGKNIRAVIDEAQRQAADKVAKGTALIKADKVAKAQEEAQAAADQAAQDRRDRFAKLLATLQLGVDRSLLTKSLGDDLDPLLALKKGLERQIRSGVDVQAAQSQLVTVTGEIAAKQEQIRQQLADALQAKQFRALGLSGTGDEIVPGLDNLTKRLKGALGKIASGDLDVGAKLASRLKAAQKLIRTEGSKLTEETRRQIDAFLKAATGQDSKVKDGPLTKGSGLNTKKILAGLGLDPQTLRELQSRLSHVNSSGIAFAGNPRIPTGNFAGGQPITVENVNTVTLDGEVLARSTTRSQEITRRRNPRQKRGPNRSGI